MPDPEQNNNDFMIEKIKERPVNKKKLVRRTLTTALMAVIFGTIACFTFLFLEPVFSSRLQPEEEPEPIFFPEDQEEMLPEEMLSENIEPEETPPPSAPPEAVELEEEQIQEILNSVTLSKENYIQLYSALSEYAAELEKYMVVVTSVESDVDWFSDVYENERQTSGVIIANNGREILILTDYSVIRQGDRLQATLYNGVRADAQMVQYHSETNLAVLSISLSTLSQLMNVENIVVAPLGSSLSKNLPGSPVIAMGSPMGSSGSIGYGMITSVSGQLVKQDGNYTVISTDIYGSQNASGVLFDMQGRVIGFITGERTGSDIKNMIMAYGISDLKKLISGMSSGSQLACLGIKGMDVPEEANIDYGVPNGAYVRELVMNSPAMQAGIQQGDVIVGFDDQEINSMSELTDALLKSAVGDNAKLKVMRLSQDEYREMEFEVTLGELK